MRACCRTAFPGRQGVGDGLGSPSYVSSGKGGALKRVAGPVFGLDDVNDLPIAYNISWYEQKAVIVLLALLYLGVKNIHLGPTLPGFLSPNVAKVLVDTFGIAGIGSVDDDIALFMGA